MSLLVLTAIPETVAEAGVAHAALVFVFIFAVRWLAYLTVIAEIAGLLQRSKNFITSAIAYNWSQVVRIVILLPAVTIFAAVGMGGSGWGAAIFYATQVAIWVYSWVIARLALDAPRGAAVGTVVVEIANATIFALIFNALV